MRKILKTTLTLLILSLFITTYAAANQPEQQTQTDLAIWTFPSTASDRLIADTGVLSNQLRLSAEGNRGGSSSNQPTFGTGANAGQLFINGWDSPNLSDKYWLIQSTSPVDYALNQHDVLEISFSAHSSNTGPRNFALEVNINNTWINAANYSLTSTTQDFIFQLPNEVKQTEYLQIRFRAIGNAAINGGIIQPAGTSRLFNIALTGIATSPQMEDIAQWQFTSLALFNNNTATATGGSQLTSTFGLAGGGNLTMGAGSAAGQLFVNGWGSATELTDSQYWHISTQTIGYSNIQISFGAHGSNTGPRNFIMEVNIGDGWIPVAHYMLTAGVQTFNFSLPTFASNASALDIRLRPGNNTAINGNAIQPAGTSRMYNIVIQGVPVLSSNAFTYTQVVEQDTQYAAVLIATDLQDATDSNLTLTYNPAMVEITSIQALTNAGINIISHEDGVLVFAFNNSDTDVLKIIVSFTAKTDGTAIFVFE